MEAIKELVPLILTLSLGLLVVAAGMASSRGDFVHVLGRPGLLARAVLAIIVIPVIAAVVVIGLTPISHATKAGIFLMAISPVPPLMPGKAFKFGGDPHYVYGLQGAGALLALVTVPVLGWLGAHFYDVDAHFPPAVVAGNIFVGLVIPLVVGVVLGRWLFPKASATAPRIIMLVANILLVVAFVPLIIGTAPYIAGLVGDGSILAIAVVVIVVITGGHLLGGPSTGDRATLTFSAAMRHPGIALALAGANHTNKQTSAAVLLFMLVGLIVMIPYQQLIRRKMREEAAAQA